jgi:hypothetical protein
VEYPQHCKSTCADPECVSTGGWRSVSFDERVEQVGSFEAVAAVIGHHLDTELIFEERAGLDAVGRVAAVKIRVTPKMQSWTLSALGCP